MARLSDSEKKAIRARYSAGETLTALAGAYTVNIATIKRCLGSQNEDKEETGVASEGIKQTYRENLNWAIQAAGEFLRTGKRPDKCPNDSAYFLYVQATNESKDFMAKISTFEKGAEDESDKEDRKTTKKTLSEIEEFLEKIDEESETQVSKVSQAQTQVRYGSGDIMRLLPKDTG